ncbi:ABC transporter substrate-binding protein [Ectothiorhodospiraceae bacterium 2226]|nr:ABC transporter substrate-binding protein [Ectothiorhodospiraceae bacterium 2226]
MELAAFAALLLAVLPYAHAQEDAPGVEGPFHGMALHGDLKYGPDFQHFEYADPDAPKGGIVRLGAVGTYDSLNPFILRGTTPPNMTNVFDTLMVSSSDEPFSVYGLIAESMEVADDDSWVIFTLRPEARHHDGTPITVEDVIFTLETLKRDGHPFYRSYYANLERAEAVGPRRVKIHFNMRGNRELPLIAAQMTVLSKAYWSERDFARTTLEPPLGNGPYRVARVDPGRSLIYERVEDYWAADLPVRRGQHNFDRMRYDFYRDSTVALEAFKAGEYDFRAENVARNWAEGYEGPALARGLIRMEEIEHQQPSGMQGFVMNTRHPVFADPRVRKAMAYLFDYEWTNRALFHRAYARTTSYFSNSDLAAEGLPSEAELALLEPFRGQIPDAVFEREYVPPATDGTGSIRPNMVQAYELLTEAGWEIRDRRMVHAETGQPLTFEILLVNPSFERVALPYARNLRRLGIEGRVRTVDSTQYQHRLDHFDFDMTVIVLPQSLSPGNEQRDYWTSAAADMPGSRNYAGIRDPAVDALVDRLIAAETRADLVAAARALDRVLLWGHYVVPNWHTRVFRVAYWDKFDRPAVSPPYALGFETWWVDAEREAALRRQGGPRSVRGGNR